MGPISRLPPIAFRCDICSNEKREDGGDSPLLRCSVCKYRFYCSAACQMQDWKEHKHSCSFLPPDGLELAEIQSDEEREKTIRDYAVRLKLWVEEHKRIKNKIPGGQLRFGSSRTPAATALIEFTFPENLQYERHPPARNKYPYRLTLMLAARAALIQIMSQRPTWIRTSFASRVDRAAEIPAKWTRLFGPKIMARPESLSPGEYEVFATLAPVFLIEGKKGDVSPLCKLSMEEMDFWVMLSEAFKELWYTPWNMVYDGK